MRAGPTEGSGRGDRSGGRARTYIVVGAVVAAFVVGFVALVVIDSRREEAASSTPGGVRTYDVGPAGELVEGDADYGQIPPAGGEHSPVLQNEGFYEEPVRDENAVHTMEHGAVWITYAPDLPQGQKDEIRRLVEGQTCMLASPHPDLPAPVVASAWGKQLAIEGADDPALGQFVRAYRLGPQTPEPGAVCTGGTSATG